MNEEQRKAFAKHLIDVLGKDNDWQPGDPCHTCGSTDTVWVSDGILTQAHCNGCGKDDWEDD